MSDGTLRPELSPALCFVTTEDMDREAKRYKQPNHPYTARNLVLGLCEETDDRQKLW